MYFKHWHKKKKNLEEKTVDIYSKLTFHGYVADECWITLYEKTAFQRLNVAVK